MNWTTIFICHFLVIGITLALPASKDTNKKAKQETTTLSSVSKVLDKQTEGQKSGKNEQKTAKIPTKKRDIPEALVDKPEELEENPEDFYEGKSPDDYAKALALESSFDNARIENAILKAESYGDPASMNEYRYYGGEDRRKRTAVFDGIYPQPKTFAKREIELTPDEVIELLALWQQQRLNNRPSHSLWSDADNSIDLQENDLEDEDIYNNDNDRYENRYEDLYSQSLPYWGNFAKDKRFMVSRRSNFLGNPKLRVPVFRRAIL